MRDFLRLVHSLCYEQSPVTSSALAFRQTAVERVPSWIVRFSTELTADICWSGIRWLGQWHRGLTRHLVLDYHDTGHC